MLNIDRKTKTALNWLKTSELRMGHSMKDFEAAEDQIERLIRCIKHSKSQRAKTLTPKEMKYRIGKISTFYGKDHFYSSFLCRTYGI